MKKSRIKILTLALLGLFLSAKSHAQVLPPEFLCVRGDTLFWNTPSNSCGPFLGYEVWGSQSATGPFSLLATVSNQAQDFYPFVNPSGDQWYFYLLSSYNCPGQPAIPSDTLDNRPPLVSPIEVVTVQNGQVSLSWIPSPSPEVYAYVIYRETGIGVVPVDTVFGGTTYLDPIADPSAGPQSYFVNALDQCGNTSIFDQKHTSIFVEPTLNPCRQSITLSWNPYQGWPGGIAEQQIWRSENGGAPVQVADAGSVASSFEAQNLLDGATYCFTVRAVQTGTGLVSVSNEVCLVADIVASAKGLQLRNVSVTPSNQVELTWSWPEDAELTEAQIQRSASNGNYQAISTQAPVPPLSEVNNFTDTDGGATGGKVFYRIQTTDACDSVLASNYGATMFLTVTPNPSANTNLLAWTAFDIEGNDVSEYKVFKSFSGGTTLAGTVPAGTLAFDDVYDPANLEEAQACYHVLATSTTVTQAGDNLVLDSRSNTACAEAQIRIFAPNALAPDGFNQEFRPVIALTDLAAYELLIYDRYGKLVFSTNQLEQGWNGKHNGRPLPQGVYAYIIKVELASGKKSEKRGTVALIR